MTEAGASVWRPAAGPGKLIGVLLIVALALPAAFALVQLVVTDLALARVIWGVVLFGLVGAILVTGYFVRGLTRMQYILTPYHLRVEWLRESLVIPYSGMQMAIYRREQPVRLPVREPYWPGFYVSTIDTADGAWRSIATLRPRNRVRIITRTGTIAISPDRPILFLRELEQRRTAAIATADETVDEPADIDPLPEQAGYEPVATEPAPVPEPPLQPGPASASPQPASGTYDSEAPGKDRQPATSWGYAYRHLFRTRLMGDRFSSESIAVALIILVLMTIYTVYSIDSQFEPLPIHWGAGGEPDQVVRPRGLWLFPLMAGGALVINTALATLAIAADRFVARLLVAATPVVQLVVAAALWGVMH